MGDFEQVLIILHSQGPPDFSTVKMDRSSHIGACIGTSPGSCGFSLEKEFYFLI